MVDQAVLVSALAGAVAEAEAAAADFILANVSQRMAQALREEITARGKVREKEAEEAMAAIVTSIRQLEGAGELALIREEDE